MKASLFVLFAVFSASSAFADPDPGTPFGPRFEAMQNACLKRDYAKLGHNVSKPQTEFWDYSMGEAEDIGGRTSLKVFQEPVLWARAAAKKVQNREYRDESDLATMTAALKKFADEEKLDAWGRACLTKCATAHMIKYDDSNYANFLVQPARIAEKGIGVCKQFAMLGEYVGNELGVETSAMSDFDQGKGGHSYLKITVDGVGYYSEPQDDRCEFFNLH